LTRAAGVVGRPVGHSLSPAIFGAAFRETGLDWGYGTFDVAEDELPGLIGRMGTDLWGLSVTMPYKAAVIPHLDRLSPVAEDLGAVNCIARHGDATVGHSTDGPGLVDSLVLDEGLALDGATVVLVGAGGAGRAVARALGAAGAAVVVLNRSPERAAEAVRLAGSAARLGDAAIDVPAADLVVNATNLGMAGDERSPVDPSLLRPGQVVVDLVYHPAETPLLQAAAAAGARTVGGLGMLVHQAAHQLVHWTGQDAPVAAMRAGAEAELARRGQA
jgi:shikimate dehydrogenase